MYRHFLEFLAVHALPVVPGDLLVLAGHGVPQDRLVRLVLMVLWVQLVQFRLRNMYAYMYISHS